MTMAPKRAGGEDFDFHGTALDGIFDTYAALQS
jgi:hypothetical protein